MWIIVGITPAYAGNTVYYTECGGHYRDHPRLRGEHTWNTAVYNVQMGSPPPTRGTPSSVSLVFVLGGITPAYAGNTNEQALKKAQN